MDSNVVISPQQEREFAYVETCSTSFYVSRLKKLESGEKHVWISSMSPASHFFFVRKPKNSTEKKSVRK
jgi:hypothetical protein